MCGIVGAVAERNVVPILMEGLRRLEYRGYDSAGIAILNGDSITRVRRVGKVQELQNALDEDPLRGNSGISHTRWATHGAPNEANAHPHMSEDDIAIVHNGIIENYEELRDDLQKHGFEFESQTDTEVVVHRIKHHLKKSGELAAAVRATVAELEGAYALVVMSASDPNKLVLARAGCPVVIGLGIGENFVASDVAALLPVTRKFMFLDEGDIAVVQKRTLRFSTRTAKRWLARSKKVNCRQMLQSEAISGITCRKKSTSRHAPSAGRLKSESQTAGFSILHSGRRPTRCWTGPGVCISSLVVRVITLV